LPWYKDGENCFLRFTGAFYFTLVLFKDVFDDAESQSCALSSFLGRIKGIKYFGKGMFGDGRTIIGHPDDMVFFIHAVINPDGATPAGGLEGIVEYVGPHL
jgi:hypothetical protein